MIAGCIIFIEINNIITIPFLRSRGTGSAHQYAFMKIVCTKCDDWYRKYATYSWTGSLRYSVSASILTRAIQSTVWTNTGLIATHCSFLMHCYSQTGCSFVGNIAYFHHNIGILIDSLLRASCNLSKQVATCASKFLASLRNVQVCQNV